jgi:hypothetical protein
VGLPAWEAAQQQANTDYWNRTRENAFWQANPTAQTQATTSLQQNPAFDPRSMIPQSYQPTQQAGYQNPDTTGPAYPGAAPAAAPSTSTPKQPPQQQAAAPVNPWDAQPKPASTVMSQNALATPTQTAGTTGGTGLPAGFNIRTGSTDPTDPTGQNQAVYGSNYFPGGLPGFEGVTNAQQFAALTPEQQGSYREALYLWNQRQQGLGPQPGGVVPALPGTTGGTQEVGPYPGGGWQPPVATTSPGGTTPSTTTPTQPYQNPPSGSVGTSPAGPPAFGGGQDTANSGFPFPGAYTAPAFNYNEVEDFTKNPAYQARLKESERALNRQLLNMGRSDSTGGINAFATNARSLAGEFEQEAYNRAKGENVLNYDRFLGENMTAYDRALTINKLTYDRTFQENVTNYERQFRENERKYGREMAENILAYDRQFNEDARDYERVRWLVANGFVGGNTPTGA